jgi:hypothetical protein
MTGSRVPEPSPSDAAWASHAGALDRLAAHRRRAEAEGWTSGALEREGATGAFALYGVPPGGALRTRIAEAADAAAAPPDVAIAARAVRRCAAAVGAGAGERAPSPAHDAARDALAEAVTAYTRLLRDEGESARRTVAAVAIAVRAGAAPGAAPAALARLVHETGCRCVERYYTP